MVRIQDINRELYGGFQSLEIIPIHEVYNCPIVLTNENASNFTYKEFSSSDISILPVGDSIFMAPQLKETQAGTEYTLDAGFEVNHLDVATDTYLKNFINTQVIVKGNTYNNTAIIFGSVEHPLRFNYNLLISKMIENHSKFEIMCKGSIYQNPVIARV